MEYTRHGNNAALSIRVLDGAGVLVGWKEDMYV